MTRRQRTAETAKELTAQMNALAAEMAETRAQSAGTVELGVGDELQKILDLLGGHKILGPAVKTDLDAHELLHRGLPRERADAALLKTFTSSTPTRLPRRWG